LESLTSNVWFWRARLDRCPSPSYPSFGAFPSLCHVASFLIDFVLCIIALSMVRLSFGLRALVRFLASENGKE
jgi:hypothetical protein